MKSYCLCFFFLLCRYMCMSLYRETYT
uniref:Uncharacterized protein n=1 Tax=Arundo donax TaxID=35708 RepID=A0A0A9GM48_ARUDO